MNFFRKLLKHVFGDNPRYFWPPLWVLFGLVVGIVTINIQDREFISIGPAVIWSLAFFVAGALIGMIFGVPTDPPHTKNTTVDSSDTNTATLSLPGTPLATNKNSPYTNLTQISDWLAKIIIGAGLVQLKDMPPYIDRIAHKMATGIASSQVHLEAVSSICAGMLIYNTCFGFISGYLLMRIIFVLFI